MRYVNQYFLGAVMLVAAAMGSVYAESNTVDDIVLLAGKGFGEEVLLAYVDRAEGTFTLSAEQIVNLKTAGVPERVIASMIRKKAPETVYELQTAKGRVIYQTERATATTSEPLTTLVYQPSSSYVSTYYPSTYYPSSYYYPVSSYYTSPYYYRYPYSYWPSSYSWGYSSPSFSLSFGSCWPYYSSWGRCGSGGHYRPYYHGGGGCSRPMPYVGGGGRPHGGGGGRR